MPLPGCTHLILGQWDLTGPKWEEAQQSQENIFYTLLQRHSGKLSHKFLEDIQTYQARPSCVNSVGSGFSPDIFCIFIYLCLVWQHF